MIIRRKLLLGCAAGICAPAIVRAQTLLQTGAGSTKKPSGGGAFTGPGDIVGGAVAWWGLRAYTNASIGGNCVDIIRASDSTTNTFATIAGGGVNNASIATFLTATTGKISKLYDQTGNGNHLLQATSGAQPAYTFNVVGSLPGITFVAANSTILAMAGTFNQSQPFTFSSVAKRTGSTSSFSNIIGSSVGVDPQFGFGNAPNTSLMYNGTLDSSVTITDNAFHSAQGVFNDASASSYVVDGTGHAVTVGVDGFITMGSAIGACGGGNNLDGIVLEAGIWFSAISGANLSTISSNQHTYWGF